MAWQSLVFWLSLRTHTGFDALVIVHGDDAPLAEPFERLVLASGRVQRAPNGRQHRGCVYPPRNSALSLLVAESDADYLVLCDPDIVVTSPWHLQHYAIEPNQVSFDSVSYLDVDAYYPALAPACARRGLSVADIAHPNARGGVPHIIPAKSRDTVARRWLNCLDAFFPEPGADSSFQQLDAAWLSLASMWALVMAVTELGLQPIQTRFCATNHNGHLPWPEPHNPQAPLIHYCYGDQEFNKRMVRGLGSNACAPGRPTPGSINAQIVDQVSAASRFFGYA